MTAVNARANLIERIFTQRWIERLAIYLLTVVFFYSALDKALHFTAAQAEFEAIGLHPSALLVSATIVAQLAGALLLCARRFALYAAELNAFLENLGLIGAFLMIAHCSAANSTAR